MATDLSTHSSSKGIISAKPVTENEVALKLENEKLRSEVERLQRLLCQQQQPNLSDELARGSLIFNHYSLMVNDLEISKEFYVEMLGCSVVSRPKSCYGKGCWLQLSNIQLHLMEGSKRSTGYISELKDCHRGCVNHVSFECDSVELIESKLRHFDVPFEKHALVSDCGKRSTEQIFISDPDGYYIEFQSEHDLRIPSQE